MRYLVTWLRRLLAMFGRLPNRLARRRAERRAKYIERIHERAAEYRQQRNRLLETLELRTVMTGDPVYEVGQDNLLVADVSQGVLASDNNPDGMTQASLDPDTGSPQHGYLVFNADGSFAYAPEAHYSGTDSFIVDEQNDDGSVKETHTVTINVDANTNTP